MELPPCPGCGSAEVRKHCSGRFCTWLRCASCSIVTDLRKIAGWRESP